ncbi:fused MFS/spermidine synthase [Candidatus Uabimicrobium amorphum]|uniref:Polyamine aminopropyltransferase n=1 Tax=Uabimicrobium amorphum TaxID=2596890 RepID=A0A5S9IMV3_UABAM|nr:fused MFS/spermidine synthase [Candidatus Uabimicrobium amorphum]BBM84251.1 spermidine synthase [Candidatus Uabimicrobium amorphum]
MQLLLYSLIFFSGVSALVYEIIWSRQIGLLFGNTAQSAGIVITIYFLGLAIGYKWAGKTIDSRQGPLRHYAIAEMFAGLWSFCVPSLLQYTSMNFPGINHDHELVRTVLRLTCITMIFFPTTIALGYSFPAFARFLATQQHNSRKPIITSYALNTIGAFSGVLFTVTLSIYYLGITGTNHTAASISFVCGLVAFMLSIKCKDNCPVNDDIQSKSTSLMVYCLVILSGFSILGLEVLYIHQFSLISHNSVYNFSATLCSFLFCLSLGSFLTNYLAKKTHAYFVLICLAVSFFLPLSLQFFHYATHGKLFIFANNFALYITYYFLFNLCVVVLPITTMAMILPLCWGHLKSQQAKTIGNLTFINTIAGAIGSGVTTFILIPHLGFYASFIFFAILYWCASIILLWHFAEKKYRFLPVYAIVLAICLFSPLHQYQRKKHQVIWQKDTFYGPIKVIKEKRSGNLKITQNNHYSLGSSFAEIREKRQTHIPLLLHPSPQHVVFLGMGTGLTAKGALQHQQVKHIDIIELIPEVVRAAKFFHRERDSIFEDKRVNVIVNDARHHLYRKHKFYDVIISDLFVPWHSHTGYLYTVEHYQSAYKSLKEDGIFCQWLPLYQMGEREFRIITNSFSSVFSNTSLWRGEASNSYPLVALIGFKKDVVNLANTKKRIRKLQTKRKFSVALKTGRVKILVPTDKFLHSERFFSLYMGEWKYQGRPLNTDDFPLIEFSTPITQHKSQFLHGVKWKNFREEALSKLPRKYRD